jgi:hypothetical protein
MLMSLKLLAMSLVLYDFEAPERRLRSWEVLQANRRYGP